MMTYACRAYRRTRGVHRLTAERQKKNRLAKRKSATTQEYKIRNENLTNVWFSSLALIEFFTDRASAHSVHIKAVY